MSIRTVLLAVGGAASMAIGIVGGLAAGQPDEFRIERSLTIAAPASVVFSNLDPLSKWEAWSPWKARDPSIQSTYEGPASGVGAKQSWTSKDSGSGSMTVTEIVPLQAVKVDLHFKDWDSNNASEILLVPEGQDTKVSWIMTGKNDFKGKLLWIVTSADAAIGKDFEDGLTRLKKLSEGST